MSTITQQLAAVEVAERYLAGRQSGPRPGSQEANYIAPHLADAARTLRLVARHRDEFAAIVKAAEQ